MERLMTKDIGLGFHVPKETVEENGDIITCNEYCEMIDGDCTECPIQKAFDKLAAYEKLQEQGLLLKLPCKVGDVVYYFKTLNDGENTIVIEEFKIHMFSFTNAGLFLINHFRHSLCTDLLNETVFLTKEEALRKLKELENE